MLGRFIRAPVTLFLRHEAWTIDVTIREKHGLFSSTTAVLIMGLIMPWGIFGIVLTMVLLVILPWLFGVDDAVISNYFPVISFGMLLPWWVWAMHWMVVLFALKFGYRNMALRKQERARSRLAWWRGVGAQ